jgi:hypothetical protein
MLSALHAPLPCSLAWQPYLAALPGSLARPRQPCPGSLAPAVLPRQPCPGSLAPAALPRQPCPGSLAPAALPRQPCPGSLAPPALPRQPCPGSKWCSKLAGRQSGPSAVYCKCFTQTRVRTEVILSLVSSLLENLKNPKSSYHHQLSSPPAIMSPNIPVRGTGSAPY